MSSASFNLLTALREEQSAGRKGGIYHHTQVKLAYNTNRIEGSRLSEEQTRYIYETNTLHVPGAEGTASVDDILETVNHFTCFDRMLAIADQPLAETQIKELHGMLKANTSDSRKPWFRMGAYKSRPNEVGGLATTPPEAVPAAMRDLLAAYHARPGKTINDLIDFHFRFERIHPFQDGNGRVGRLILFKECLAHGIVPFIIEDAHKFYIIPEYAIGFLLRPETAMAAYASQGFASSE